MPDFIQLTRTNRGTAAKTETQIFINLDSITHMWEEKYTVKQLTQVSEGEPKQTRIEKTCTAIRTHSGLLHVQEPVQEVLDTPGIFCYSPKDNDEKCIEEDEECIADDPYSIYPLVECGCDDCKLKDASKKLL